LNVDSLVEAFEWRSLILASNVERRLASDTQNLFHGDGEKAWNYNARVLNILSSAHVFFYALKCNRDWLNSLSTTTTTSNGDSIECINVLTRLCLYFGLSEMVDGTAWNGILTLDQLSRVDIALCRLAEELRSDMVALVDAFDFPDIVLNSALGRFDGNVYEALYEAAVKSPMNMNVNGERILVPKYFNALAEYLDKDILSYRNGVWPVINNKKTTQNSKSKKAKM
jgi:acyl-CoA oxidase